MLPEKLSENEKDGCGSFPKDLWSIEPGPVPSTSLGNSPPFSEKCSPPGFPRGGLEKVAPREKGRKGEILSQQLHRLCQAAAARVCQRGPAAVRAEGCSHHKPSL